MVFFSSKINLEFSKTVYIFDSSTKRYETYTSYISKCRGSNVYHLLDCIFSDQVLLN